MMSAVRNIRSLRIVISLDVSCFPENKVAGRGAKKRSLIIGCKIRMGQPRARISGGKDEKSKCIIDYPEAREGQQLTLKVDQKAFQ